MQVVKQGLQQAKECLVQVNSEKSQQLIANVKVLDEKLNEFKMQLIEIDKTLDPNSGQDLP